MLILKPSRDIIDADVYQNLSKIKAYILLNRPEIVIMPSWVEVIEVNDIKDEENDNQGRFKTLSADTNI